MILKADQIARELDSPEDKDDPLIITPKPNTDVLRSSGAASIDVRLGRWFLACRPSRTGHLDVYKLIFPMKLNWPKHTTCPLAKDLFSIRERSCWALRLNGFACLKIALLM